MAKKKAAKKCACSCSSTIQPLGDRVLVKREEAETMTAGGIVLPESAKNKPARGTIVALGDGKVMADGTRSSFQVEVGDRVLFISYAGEEFKIGDEEIMLMNESDILAVIG